MSRLLPIAIDSICVSIFLIPILLVLQNFFYKNINLLRRLLLIIFSVYISAVFSAVGIPTIRSIRLDFTYNWIPLIDIVNSPFSYITNTILNIILFIPIGFFASLLWKQFYCLKNITILGLGLSIFIEISQIFTFRLTDIDDLIMNTLGAILGFFTSKLFISKEVRIKTTFGKENTYSIPELFFILGLTFAITFFIQPFISDFIWLKIL